MPVPFQLVRCLGGGLVDVLRLEVLDRRDRVPLRFIAAHFVGRERAGLHQLGVVLVRRDLSVQDGGCRPALFDRFERDCIQVRKIETAGDAVAGAGRDQLADDHVLLQAAQVSRPCR